jgi:hypothetical protein
METGKMKKTKKYFFSQVRDCSMVKVVLECSICGEEYESDMNYCFDDSEVELDEFTNSLYDYGWRIFYSKEYRQVGLTCGDCIENEQPTN